jgi:hypothetical protein
LIGDAKILVKPLEAWVDIVSPQTGCCGKLMVKVDFEFSGVVTTRGETS